MVTAVALVVDHVRVDLAPETIETGEPIRVAVGSSGRNAVTVTVAVAVTAPVALVAVSV